MRRLIKITRLFEEVFRISINIRIYVIRCNRRVQW